MFQSFDVTSDPSHGPARLQALRAVMREDGLDAVLVPRSDRFQGEYVAPADERLAWLTGFTGSAGTAVVLLDKAALVVDGRYTLQAPAQVDAAVVTPVPLAETRPEAWIEAKLPQGGVLAYDPCLHTVDGVKRLEKAVERAGGELEPVDINLVDVIWVDRPAAP